MGRSRFKTGRIYIKLYMSILIRKNFSHPPKVFSSETLYFKLPKNLVVCFKETLVLLLLDTTKTSHSCLLLLNFKATNFTVATKTENLRKPPESTQNHLQAPKTISNHPKPSMQKHLQSS